MLSFSAIADDADGAAKGGRPISVAPPTFTEQLLPFRLTSREAHSPSAHEQDLLEHLIRSVDAAGSIARSLIIDYYISLKTNPFVVLTGPEGVGKVAFVQRFAESLVGSEGAQYALIPATSGWTGRTGHGGYFRELQQRFSSWRFLELLQEASAPENLGRLFLVCFNHLHPDELEYYFTSLLQVRPDGQRQLVLPGFPPDELPILPPNLLITATVDVEYWGMPLSRQALRQVGLIEFRNVAPHVVNHHPMAPPLPGWQRIWMRSRLPSLAAAEQRLNRILGPRAVLQLRPSTSVSQMLWDTGVVLTSRSLKLITWYVAHSFDANGRGLFDPRDPHRNAQLAYDAQVLQRVLQSSSASGRTLYPRTTPIRAVA